MIDKLPRIDRYKFAGVVSALSLTALMSAGCSGGDPEKSKTQDQIHCEDLETKFTQFDGDNPSGYLSTLIVRGASDEYGVISVNRSGPNTVIGLREDDEKPVSPEPISIVYEKPDEIVNRLSLDLAGATWDIKVSDADITIDGEC